MRKALLLAAVAALVGIASASYGATSLTFNIGITVRATTVDIATGTANLLDWYIVPANVTATSATNMPNSYTASVLYQVINVGSVNIDLALQQTTPAAGWTVLETGAPGAVRAGTQYRLFAGFTDYFPAHLVADYGAEDIVKSSISTIANNVVGGVYALAGQGGLGGVGAYTGGVNIIPEPASGPQIFQGTRNLQFAIDTPVTVDGSTKSIGITVLATAH